MPAVTADLLTLPASRASRRAASHVRCGASSPPSGRSRARAFPSVAPFPASIFSLVDPFILLDQMGAVEYAPRRGEGGTRPPAPRLRDGHLHAWMG